MARYIDADKLIDAIEELPQQELITLLGVYSAILKALTADVQEVRHGYYWGTEAVNSYMTKWCSCCKNRVPLANYCQVCGAKMDGKD